MTVYSVIDIAKDKSDVNIIRPGYDPEPASFENTRKGFNQFHIFLKKRQLQGAHVCMEATGVYQESLAEFLH